MRMSQRRRRQRHSKVGMTFMHQPAISFEIAEWGRFTVHDYQKLAIEKLQEVRIHDSFHCRYPQHFVNPDGSWLRDFQSQPRAPREVLTPLIIKPLTVEGADRFIVTTLSKKRLLKSEPRFKFEPMQGDISNGWSVVDPGDEFNQNTSTNEESNDG